MNGLEVADLLRQFDPKAATVLMTGGAEKPASLSAPDGAVILEKPFRHSALVDALGDLLN